MGQILDQWLAKNAPQLEAMSGMPPSFDPAITGAPGGIPPTGFGQPPGGPQMQPGFPMPSGPSVGPGGAGGFPAPGGGPAPAFAPQTPVAVPVDVQAPAKPAPTEAPRPKKKGDANGFSDLYKDADPKQIDKAIEVMEQTSGASVEELYQKQTGNPPPQGAGKREIGEFLFEFGLNLLSSPAGQSSAESVGRSATAAVASRRGREEKAAAGRAAAEDRRIGRLDKKFDREVTMEKLDLERQKVQADLNRSTGTFENYIGDDGYMYTYNEQTGEGRRVMVNGKPVKPDPKQNKSKTQRFDTEVRYNLYMDVHGKDEEGTPLEGTDLRRAREGALRFSNRAREYTKDEARRDAVKQATTVLSKSPDFTLATPEEQKQMLEEKVGEYTELLMYGSGPGQGQPDISRLAEGVATPVTNDETGVMEYWTVRDGSAVKVDDGQVKQ